MRSYQNVLLPALALVALGGCVQPTPPAPPETVTGAMADALTDTGFYEDVAITRTIGRHYSPTDDAWTIVACYRFTVPDGREGTACLDSFSALQLENGTWLVSATVNGVYRWRAIGMPQPAAEATPGQPAGSPAVQPPDEPAEEEPEQPSEEPPGQEPEQEQGSEPGQPADSTSKPA